MLNEIGKNESHFFMPIPPTPNGRLHLGHIAGPYLRVDVLARYLSAKGENVSVVTAVDGFDSYVEWRALQEGRRPEDICSYYRGLIQVDLHAIDIRCGEVHDFVNGPYAELHASSARRLVERLTELGCVEVVTERVLYSAKSNRYVVGAWLSGHCPRCGSAESGYFCEACGGHFKPQDMVKPYDRLGESELEWRDVDSLFLRIADVKELERRIVAAGGSGEFVNLILKHIDSEGPLFRLTAPGSWGVKWTPDRFGNPRVLFESGWEYALTCGAIAAESSGVSPHPMSSSSSSKTLVSFGIDNAVLLLMGSIAVMSSDQELRPFDNVLTNYFYNLQGRKFSTSRRHAIWAADIVSLTPSKSDAIRFYLGFNSPEHSIANFDVHEFIDFVNGELVEGLQPRVRHALGVIAGDQSSVLFSGEVADLLRKALSSQRAMYELPDVSLRDICRHVAAWWDFDLDTLSSPVSAYWWLKGLSILAWPVMPSLAQAIWLSLGMGGEPTEGKLLVDGVGQFEDAGVPLFDKISLDSLQPCLPESMFVAEVS